LKTLPEQNSLYPFYSQTFIYHEYHQTISKNEDPTSDATGRLQFFKGENISFLYELCLLKIKVFISIYKPSVLKGLKLKTISTMEWQQV
jgi:hypothetical protein